MIALLLALLTLAAQDEPVVTTMRLAPVAFERSVRLPGTVLPWEEATLIPYATGYVEKIDVRMGSRVKQGDVLVSLQVPLMDQDLAHAAAQVAAADAQVAGVEAEASAHETTVAMRRSALDRTRAEVDWREVQWKRLVQLLAKDAETEQAVEDAAGALAIARGRANEAEAAIAGAQAEALAVRSRVEVARAERAVAQARLARLEAMRDFATIRCPFPEALVVERLVDPGSLVEAGETALLRVMDVEKVRVLVYVDERDALRVEAGSAVVLTADAGGPPLKAKVSRIASALDPATRRMALEIDLDNPGYRLRPGMFMNADLEVFHKADALLAPARCLRFDGEGASVFVVEDGRLVRKQVETGLDDGIQVEIVSGVSAGAEVVISGPERLVPGASVRTKAEVQR